jgi:hypothetical protein
MPDRTFTVKPMYRSLPRRDWRWTLSQSILIAMEVFSWRSGRVGCGRTEDRPLQRSKTSSGGMSQSCPYYPGQILCQLTSTQVIQGSNCLSIGPKDNNKRMTIEHAECSIQSTKRALAISTRQHPALLFTDTQKLLGCLGLDGVNQVKLGPLRSLSAVNTRFV